MDNDISSDESPIATLNRINKSLDAMEKGYNRSRPNAVISDGHVRKIRERLEEPKDVVMTGTEEFERAAAQQKSLPGVKSGAVEKIVRKIEAMKTEQLGQVAARQDTPSEVQPGKVANAVENIENRQAAEGRAQLDERNDHARSGRGR